MVLLKAHSISLNSSLFKVLDWVHSLHLNQSSWPKVTCFYCAYFSALNIDYARKKKIFDEKMNVLLISDWIQMKSYGPFQG